MTKAEELAEKFVRDMDGNCNTTLLAELLEQYGQLVKEAAATKVDEFVDGTGEPAYTIARDIRSMELP